MRTSTEFASEISAPRISSSFEIHAHLDFLVNLGEVGVYHLCMCMCFIVSNPCLVTPCHRFVMMHYVDKKEQFLSYTSQLDTTLRKKGCNVRLGTCPYQQCAAALLSFRYPSLRTQSANSSSEITSFKTDNRTPKRHSDVLPITMK